MVSTQQLASVAWLWKECCKDVAGPQAQFLPKEIPNSSWLMGKCLFWQPRFNLFQVSLVLSYTVTEVDVT